MKKLNLNKKALTLLVTVIAMLLLVALPTALAWNEGSGWYINANYGGHYLTLPLDIQIDGVSGDYQVFNVGDTVTITGDAYSYVTVCAGGTYCIYQVETKSYLAVAGPSGPDSDTGSHLEISFCTQVDNTVTPEARTITYPLTALGEHSVYMYSHARFYVVSGGCGPPQGDFVDASITFYVINPFTSVGECISTKIEAECAGVQGPERAGCVKEQIGYCHEMFDVSSAHTE